MNFSPYYKYVILAQLQKIEKEDKIESKSKLTLIQGGKNEPINPNSSIMRAGKRRMQ